MAAPHHRRSCPLRLLHHRALVLSRLEGAQRHRLAHRGLLAGIGAQLAAQDADRVRQAVLAQYAAHKSWSIQLHHDNLVALAETRSDLKPSAPKDATLRRFLKANGLDKRRRVTSRQTAGADGAEARLFDRDASPR